MNIKDIETKLNALELQVAQLVNGYTCSTKQYSESLASLKTLTTQVADAPLRASNGAQLALEATKKAAHAAKESASQLVVHATFSAAQAAAFCADAATEAATSAASAATAAAEAVRCQTVKRHLERLLMPPGQPYCDLSRC